MLKKAGIVVLGATAGVMSLSGMAFAGESEHSSDDSGSRHHEHHDKDRGGSCDKTAVSNGDRLLSLDNVASNLDISRLNVLGKDDSINFGDECKGDKTAVSQGDRLISADNLLANADVSRLNVLGKDGSVNGVGD